MLAKRLNSQKISVKRKRGGGGGGKSSAYLEAIAILSCSFFFLIAWLAMSLLAARMISLASASSMVCRLE
jgi:hypothetical protein